MRSVLKTCQLELKVKGPVFVGSGYEIQKKEYILQGHKAGVVNPQKLFMLAKKKHLEAGAGTLHGKRYKRRSETLGDAKPHFNG